MTADPRHNSSPTGLAEDAYVLPLREILLIFWRRLWIILLAIVVCAAIAVGASLVQQPVYEASIKVLVGQESGITESPNNASGLQDLTQTMAEAVASRSVAESVVQQADLQVDPDTFLEDRLSVSQVDETQFVEVSYQGTDPQKVQQVANTVGDVFSERISNISPDANSITATVWEQAVVPDQPVSPNPLRNGLLGAFLGGVLGTGLAFLLGYLNDRWRSPEELEQTSGVPVFGIIPHFEVQESRKKGKS